MLFFKKKNLLYFLLGKNIFDVNHPPANSIDLTLNNYLSSIELSKKNKFWLDFKNLSLRNENKSLQKLKSICASHKLDPNQFIIESTRPEFLQSFHHNGFKTSYYLPWNLKKKSKKNLKKELNFIAENILTHKTHFISGGIEDYEIISKRFPIKKILTWSCHFSKPLNFNPITIIREIYYLNKKIKLFNNPNVEIILFKYKSKKGNR